MGQGACCNRAREVEPSSMPRKPPRPWEPTTSSWACFAASTSARMGRSRVITMSTSTLGYCSRRGARRSCSSWVCSSSTTFHSCCAAARPAREAWTCMSIHVWMASILAPRASASAKANSVACWDTSEPSTPTTTGPYLFSSVRWLSSRTTTTGQCAWDTTAAETDPITMPESPPRPREPMTIILLVSLSSNSMSMGVPSAMV